MNDLKFWRITTALLAAAVVWPWNASNEADRERMQCEQASRDAKSDKRAMCLAKENSLVCADCVALKKWCGE